VQGVTQAKAAASTPPHSPHTVFPAMCARTRSSAAARKDIVAVKPDHQLPKQQLTLFQVDDILSDFFKVASKRAPSSPCTSSDSSSPDSSSAVKSSKCDAKVPYKKQRSSKRVRFNGSMGSFLNGSSLWGEVHQMELERQRSGNSQLNLPTTAAPAKPPQHQWSSVSCSAAAAASSAAMHAPMPGVY
jgi:hypothetical protein